MFRVQSGFENPPSQASFVDQLLQESLYNFIWFYKDNMVVPSMYH